MATQTPNLSLTKPAGTDYVRIGDFNDNADKLDASIGDLGQLATSEKTSLVLAINEAATTGGANAPYIGENLNWWVWDSTTAQYVDTGIRAPGPEGPKGEKGDTGDQGPKGETGAGLDILGTYPTVEALEAAVTSPAQGDMYNVGLAAPFNVYMWDVELNDWIDQGVLQGPPGPDGADGKSGVFFGPVEDAPEDAIVVVDPAGAVFNTDNVPEGATNKYYTDARVDQRLAGYKIGTTANLPVFTGEGGAVGTKTAAEALTALGAAKKPVTQTVTLLKNNWTAAGDVYSQLVDAVGVRANPQVIHVSPAPDPPLACWAYMEAGVFCYLQNFDSLSFLAKQIPTYDIDVNVMIVG